MKPKSIALVAHDNKKQDLLELSLFNRERLIHHQLCATGTTSRLLKKFDRETGNEELERRIVAIAERYGTSVRSICVANNIRHRNFIRAGQKLKIPQKGMRVYPVVASHASEPARRPSAWPTP